MSHEQDSHLHADYPPPLLPIPPDTQTDYAEEKI